MTADSLQGDEHLGNEVVALLQGNAQRLLAVVQRRQTRLGLLDSVFHGADARGRLEYLLIEFSAVVADELDLSLELCLLLQDLSLLGAERLELLVVLLEAVEADRRREAHWRGKHPVILCGRRNARLRQRRLRRRRQAEGQQNKHCHA